MPVKIRPASFVDLLLGRLTRSLLVTAALAMTPIAAAHATEIGNVLKFRAPIVGCSVFGDAREALRLRTLYGPYAAEEFARVVGFANDRSCAIFGQPRYNGLDESEWKVMQKASPVGGMVRSDDRPEEFKPEHKRLGQAWFCIEPMNIYDVSPPREGKPQKPFPCYWIFMSDTPAGTY
jgi:hypothetical protein